VIFVLTLTNFSINASYVLKKLIVLLISVWNLTKKITEKRVSPQEAKPGTILASVLLQLFINGNERCHISDPPPLPQAHELKVNNIQSVIPVHQTNTTTRWCKTWRHFTAATQALNNSCRKLHSTEKIEKKTCPTCKINGRGFGLCLVILQIHAKY